MKAKVRRVANDARIFVTNLCQKIEVTKTRDNTLYDDIEKKIDAITEKLEKRDKLIQQMDQVLEEDEIILEVKEEGYILAKAKELKDFSIEIGRNILQVHGDFDLIAYKKKAQKMMELETRQKATITQLELDVERLKAVIQEKEANISDLQVTNTALKSIDDMSEDVLKRSAQEAESKALTFQQEIRKYERLTLERQKEVDQLQRQVDELKSQLSMNQKKELPMKSTTSRGKLTLM